MVDLWVFLNVVALCTTILIVWFRTSAFVEYARLIGLRKYLLGYENDNNGLSYPQYLYIKSKQILKSPICLFFINLITCPICLGMWLSIFGACIFMTYIQIPLTFISVLVSYYLVERVIG